MFSNIMQLFFLFSFSSVFFYSGNSQGIVDEYCVNCICQEGCAITYNFWVDAGRPTVRDESPRSETAFQNCYQDYFCSATAIQIYMLRYQRDCNNDGNIDCLDFAAIHRYGADGCLGRDADIFVFQVYSCLQKRKK